MNLRLFVAARFAPEALHELSRAVARVRPQLPDGSWPRIESYHLTLAFLDDQPEEIVPRLSEELDRRVRTVPAFDATLNGCSVFPRPARARVGWVAAEPRDAFVELAGRVRDAVAAVGLTVDREDFIPHLTVVRMRTPWRLSDVQMFIRLLSPLQTSSSLIDHVTLFSSRLNPSGAVHTPIHSAPLGPKP